PGYSSVQLTLGRLYADGAGVPQNFAEAARWYQKAAADDPLAAVSLGDLYAEGRGVDHNDTEATRWYRRAAERGLATGEYKLAQSCLTGKGIRADRAEGYAWLDLAASQEPQKYQAELAKLREQLTPEQLAEAQRTLAELKRKLGK